MLADELDYVIGVDPHRDAHALAVVEVRSGGVIFETDVVANESGYRAALSLAVDCAPGRRAFAVEGSGSFGAGLTRFLTASGEQVFEVGRLRRERVARQDRRTRRGPYGAERSWPEPASAAACGC